MVDAIRNAIVAVPGTLILDQHSDLDHNRTVITFAGPPETITDAAFAGIKEAALRIDLNEPYRTASRIVQLMLYPLYLSGLRSKTVFGSPVSWANVSHATSESRLPLRSSCSDPERVNLEKIRRGEFEGLKSEIHLPERKPDFGPSELGPAGATVIGARKPLVAFNVYLTTDDTSIADRISRAVRHSSGGLRFVKALGMQVDGLAQVSMNLTDTTRTPVARVVELIRREAARYGVHIHHQNWSD